MSLDTVGSMSASQYAVNLFSQLDTQKKGYLEETDFSGLTAASTSSEAANAGAKGLFAAMDTDGDGKVTESELSSTLTSLAEALMQDLRQASSSREGTCDARASEANLDAYALNGAMDAGASGQLIASA